MIDKDDFVDPDEHPTTFAIQAIMAIIYYILVLFGMGLVLTIIWPILGF